MQAFVFFECRHWCFRGRGIGVFVRRRHCFFLGENLRAAKKNGKTLYVDEMDKQKGPRRRFHARMPIARRLCDGFKPTRCPCARGRPAVPAARAPRAAADDGRRRPQNVNDGRNPDFARGAMCCLFGADGNVV